MKTTKQINGNKIELAYESSYGDNNYYDIQIEDIVGTLSVDSLGTVYDLKLSDNTWIQLSKLKRSQVIHTLAISVNHNTINCASLSYNSIAKLEQDILSNEDQFRLMQLRNVLSFANDKIVSFAAIVMYNTLEKRFS